MPVAFGFSVGDFLGAIHLVHTVIEALKETGEATTKYKELLSQLPGLGTALKQVKELEIHDEQYDEVTALKQAASACQSSIDGFFQSIRKYQPSLRSCEPSKFKSTWIKVRWALGRKDDIMKFQMDLADHTQTIQILCTSVQM